MKFTKKLLSLLLAIAMLFSITAGIDLTALASEDDWSYFLLKDGTVEVAYNGSDSNVTIPSTIDGYKVTALRDFAFGENANLESVTIPNSITNIDEHAFINCINLTSISIPDSVASIGTWAFSGCESLASITIGNGIKNIGDAVFAGTAYYYDQSNWTDGELYIGNCLIEANVYESSAYQIKSGTTVIADGAILGGQLLTSISIPSTVISIGSFPLGYNVFSLIDNLSSITVDSNNEYYSSENGILYNKNKTELIQYPAGKTEASFTIPDSVTNIKTAAFYKCIELTSITIPNSVISIEAEAFNSCRNLTSVTIGDSVTGIGSHAFSDTAYYCNQSNWTNGVLYISNYLIAADAEALPETCTIKDGTTIIAEEAFFWCDSLTNVIIPNSVINIGDKAFFLCFGLTSVTIGNSVTSIGNEAFNGCGLTSIVIPNSVTSIGEYAFSGCSSLTSATIPSSVTSIGDLAFGSVYYDFAIYCYYNSYAHKYAETNSINYRFISSDGIEKINTFETKTITFAYAGEKNYLYFTPNESGEYHLNVSSDGAGSVNCGICDSNLNYANIIYDPNNHLDYYPLEKGETYYIVAISNDLPIACNVTVELKHNHEFSNSKCTICGISEFQYTILSDGTIGIKDYLGSASSLTIPSTFEGYKVTIIDYDAFSWCESLSSVSIPDSVTSIGEFAFSNCTSLTSVTIPKSVKSIGNFAFSYCYSLSNVYYDGTIKEWNKTGVEGIHTDLFNATIYCSDGVINKTCMDHSWNGGEVTKKATCKATGVKTYTCTKCGETKTETIAKTAHTYKTTTTKATTSKNGKIVKKCTICGASTTTTIYYPKTITLSTTSYTYNGKAKKPSVTVKDSKGNKIASSNYTVSYQSGRKNVGTYTVTIKFKGNYSGTVKKTFTIKPKATTLSSVTAGKKKFTAKWKKQATQTTGYQIQYSTDKNFKKNNKSVTVSKNKTTSKSVSKLTAKKKYYVRVRTYKTVKVNGKSTKIYSAWSKSKAVTTKK